MPPITQTNKAKNFKKSFKDLLGSIKKYGVQIIIGLICATISTILGIIGPDVLREITNMISKSDIVFSDLTRFGISLIIIYVSSFLLSFIQNFILNGVTAKIAKDFRGQISLKINTLPLRYLDGTPYGDVLSRVTNDVDLLADTLANSLSSMITCITTLIGSIIMMLIYSWKLTLIAIVILPISMLVIGSLFKVSQKYFKAQQDALGDINGHIEEIYSGHNVVSVYNAQDIANEKFDEINNRLFSSSVKGNLISGIMHPLMNFFGNIGYALIIILGCISALKSSSPLEVVSMVSIFVIYYKMFNNQVGQVASISSTIQTTMAASERIFEFLQEPSEEDESNKKKLLRNIKGELTFENVSFGYTPEKEILHDLNVEIKPGQKVAVVGPTGAGKTTLVNLLMRFYDVNSGSIKIDGVDINELKRENVRKLFGMVLQDTWLFEGTIKENIAYGKKNVSDEDIINVCKSAGIHHLIMSQPKGYDMVLNEETTFSSGEKQLITIARAMLHNAPMLILDEATSSVDTRTEVLIQNAMDELLKGRTSIIIAHRLSTIVNADLILVMKDGMIVEQGTHTDLIAKNGVYAGLYNAQF